MPKPVDFEKLVATIVGELEPTADARHDERIVCKNSGISRQIDVSIRRSNPDFLGIVEAKDHGRPLTAQRIDAFTGVMRDVGANYGALA